jgi:hypothetical protein
MNYLINNIISNFINKFGIFNIVHAYISIYL